LSKKIKTQTNRKKLQVKRMSKSQPKARFNKRINEQDYLGVTVWPTKADPNAEVIAIQISRNVEEKWETIARLAVYRSPDGKFSELPDRQQ
jgi:predicted DNA binding protein